MENLSLYQITSAFPMLMEQEEMTEEDKIKVEEELTKLLQEKSQSIIGYYRNNELTIQAMKEEEKRIAEVRKALENRNEKFKKYVKECMENAGFTKIETTLGSLSVARSPISIEIVNEDEVPSEYKIEIVTTKTDKKAIADNFKATGEVPNGIIVHTENTNLRIK